MQIAWPGREEEGYFPSTETGFTLLQRYETSSITSQPVREEMDPPMLEMLTMAALLQLIPEPGLSWAAFFSRGRNACGEWKERHAQRRLVGRHVSFHSGSYQSSRIREQLLADISVDHLVQPPLPKQSHQEPIAQDHVQVTFGHLQGRTMSTSSHSKDSATHRCSKQRQGANSCSPGSDHDTLLSGMGLYLCTVTMSQ